LVLDAAKLSFGSFVLGTIIKGEIPQATLLTVGIIASAAGALGGILLITLCEEKWHGTSSNRYYRFYGGL
jgi:hypothetical protein